MVNKTMPIDASIIPQLSEALGAGYRDVIEAVNREELGADLVAGKKRRSPARRKASPVRGGGRSPKRWVQGVVQKLKSPGSFAAKAHRHNMSTQRFACHVLAHPSDFPLATRRQATLFQNMQKSRSRSCNRRR